MNEQYHLATVCYYVRVKLLFWAGCVALCYDDFSEKSKLSNVELG